jgi:hypothetical protein
MLLDIVLLNFFWRAPALGSRRKRRVAESAAQARRAGSRVAGVTVAARQGAPWCAPLPLPRAFRARPYTRSRCVAQVLRLKEVFPISKNLLLNATRRRSRRERDSSGRAVFSRSDARPCVAASAPSCAQRHAAVRRRKRTIVRTAARGRASPQAHHRAHSGTRPCVAASAPWCAPKKI